MSLIGSCSIKMTRSSGNGVAGSLNWQSWAFHSYLWPKFAMSLGLALSKFTFGS